MTPSKDGGSRIGTNGVQEAVWILNEDGEPDEDAGFVFGDAQKAAVLSKDSAATFGSAFGCGSRSQTESLLLVQELFDAEDTEEIWLTQEITCDTANVHVFLRLRHGAITFPLARGPSPNGKSASRKGNVAAITLKVG